MNEISPSEESPSQSDGRSSFFDMPSGDEGDSSSDRIRELKRILFDLTYLVMNADGTEHISEKMLVEKLEHRMEREGSVDVEARTEDLGALLQDGPDAIRERVLELAEEVADRAGDRTQELGARYLDLLKGLIVADASVDPEEHELFEALCERWEVEQDLPR